MAVGVVADHGLLCLDICFLHLFLLFSIPWLFFLFSSVSLVLKATLLGLGKIVVWVQMFSFKNVTLKNHEYGVVAVSF